MHVFLFVIGCDFTMHKAAAEIFSLSSIPTILQIRQFWAAFVNHVFGTSDSTVLAAIGDVTSIFTHSEATYRYNYSSNIADSCELTHRTYHSSLGANNAVIIK